MNKTNFVWPFLKAFLFSQLILFANTAFAAPDIGEMFSNFSSSAIQLMHLVSGLSFILGLAISWKAALSFKEYADGGGRTQLKTPFGLLLAGVFLITFPGTINMATETLSLGQNTGSVLSDVSVGSGEAGSIMTDALKGVLLFVKLVGHIAVLRGILMLKKISEGAQGAELSRALWHIAGGAMAININKTVEILGNTVGMGNLLG